MGFRAAQYAYNLVVRLSTAQRCLFRQAAWSCRDDDGFLPRSKAWLGEKCAVSIRGLERHLPVLEKLGLLTWNGEGFRLPGYLLASGMLRQSGGGFTLYQDAAPANLSANLRKEKVVPKESICRSEWETPPYPSPQAVRERRMTRAERKEIESASEAQRLRARPRAHWPCGLDGDWIPAQDRCFTCGENYMCALNPCLFAHDSSEAVCCERCMSSARERWEEKARVE